MNLARQSVQRPVLTTMVALIVVILGVISLQRLPIDLMPDISYPSLSVFVSYTNADPKVVEQLITKPIEEAMAAVPGIEEINSTSSEGQSSVRLAFAWGTDLEAAASDVRDRLDRVMGRLPDGVERPRMFRFDASSFPIMALGIVSDIDQVELRAIVEDQVSYRLERVPGVASAEVWGGLGRQVQINLVPERLEALDIPVDQILARVKAANVQAPVGTLYEGRAQRTLRTSGLLASLPQIEETTVAVRQGVPVRLGQVAEISDSFARPTRIARINGRPGIRLAVSKQSGKNTVEVAKAVRQEIERLRRDLPQLEISIINDSSTFISSSIGNVGNAAVYGGLIALLVLLFFLRSVPSTLIIATSIPLSIIATFALMYFSGFTLNIMSLGGLALGVGMLVDNSIVMLENIYRLRETGEGATEAAIKGSAEVGVAVVASTLTTLVVFLPLVLVRGISGVMYKQLAVVVSFALACSLVSALTLVPMMSAKILKPRTADPQGNGRGRLAHLTGGLLARLDRVYNSSLAAVLRRPALTLGIVGLMLAGSVLLATRIGFELMPRTDEGSVQGRRFDGSGNAAGDHRRRDEEHRGDRAPGGARGADDALERRRRRPRLRQRFGPDQPEPQAAARALALRRADRGGPAAHAVGHPRHHAARAHRAGLLHAGHEHRRHRACPDRDPGLRPRRGPGPGRRGSRRWPRRCRASPTLSSAARAAPPRTGSRSTGCAPRSSA